MLGYEFHCLLSAIHGFLLVNRVDNRHALCHQGAGIGTTVRQQDHGRLFGDSFFGRNRFGCQVQLDRFLTLLGVGGFTDFAQGFGLRFCNGNNCFCFTLCLENLFSFIRFSGQDLGLLFPFCNIDCCLAVTFRFEDLRPFDPLRLHLCFHGFHH